MAGSLSCYAAPGLPLDLGLLVLGHLAALGRSLAAEREAAVTAQEQTGAEMRQQTDSTRAQRHDFVNYVRVMLALLPLVTD